MSEIRTNLVVNEWTQLSIVLPNGVTVAVIDVTAKSSTEATVAVHVCDEGALSVHVDDNEISIDVRH